MTQQACEKVSPVLVEMMARYVEAWNQGDVDGCAAFLAEDCAMCDSVAGLQVGRAANRVAIQRAISDGVKIGKIEVLEGEVYGGRCHFVQHGEIIGPDGQLFASVNTLGLGRIERGTVQITHSWEIYTPTPGE